MRSSSPSKRFSVRFLGMLFVSAVLGACSTTLPGAPVTTNASDGNQELGADVHDAQALQVVPVHGNLVAAGRALRGRVHAFRSPLSPAGAKVELYVAAFPTEEFDADVVDAISIEPGWFAATVRLRQPDARLAPDMPFAGRIVLADTREEFACSGPTP